ncbi:hypothetical protein [Neorhizobium galegae]|uniref:hypothetical protein n=1 Tax=Neorhizobium galegae TaxID=399 RepID=UPI0021085512|nr:hypothetical protein [Neorhizobium galegae]MCQ1838202.1 hypothetical protein [Neorhizobium galegae]UIY32027.1 hypothetical protein LZK73_24150 [Neorhizobium galegae]
MSSPEKWDGRERPVVAIAVPGSGRFAAAPALDEAKIAGHGRSIRLEQIVIVFMDFFIDRELPVPLRTQLQGLITDGWA